MEIGRIAKAEDDHECDEEDCDVGVIGRNLQCFNCGGWGHASRECPSERKGKGGPKGGKGGSPNGKGGKGKGDGKGKGGGKGYQGACYNCGKIGHKAWECRGGKGVNAVDEDEDQEQVTANSVEIGTIWSIGAVSTIDVQKVEAMEAEDDPKTKKIEITLDSGAGASCWPRGLLKKVPLKPKMKGMRFRAANGSELKYYGTKSIRFTADGGGGECDMNFHVTDTTKPLASAMAVTRMGNRVVLESGVGNSYIENIATGKRILLKERGGTYVFDTDCAVNAISPVFSRQE
jgi:hypothetical protein